ncbi:META domain-containing protein [Actinophytocola sp.]|uniref:META domain-containing protein n=1 Tax=Actinophytocola sp. TaxID=1872138 RepID=UPI002ED38A23
MRLAYVAVPLLLLLAGCGGQPAEPAGSPVPDLRGRTFLATAVTEDGAPRTLLPGTELSVEFTDDGLLKANAGCNFMQGQVDTSGGKLAIKEGSTTEMGCDQPRLDQDNFVFGALGASPSWQLSGDQLTITSGTTTFQLAPREAVDPDRALAGTTWELDTLVDGDVASSMPAGAQPVTLTFDGAQIAADTHCNSVTAKYTQSGDKLQVEPGPMTRKMCAPEIMQGETAVAGVLQGEVTYEITADRLTLTNSSGKGIQLRAR